MWAVRAGAADGELAGYPRAQRELRRQHRQQLLVRVAWFQIMQTVRALHRAHQMPSDYFRLCGGGREVRVMDRSLAN